MDPRDTGTPVIKEWEEFRASFAGFLLQWWLLRDLHEIAPDYPAELYSRLERARDLSDMIPEEEDDKSYPIPSPVEEQGSVNYDWWDEATFHQLGEQLFPHGYQDPAGDFEMMSYGFLTVSLHSAFEKFCKDLGVHEHGNLAKSILAWFGRREISQRLSARTADRIRNMDATRHLYVHNRGIVNEKYLLRVHDSQLQLGERCIIRSWDVFEMAEATWETARQIVIILKPDAFDG